MAYGELNIKYYGPRKSHYGIVGPYYPNLNDDGMVIRKGGKGPKEHRAKGRDDVECVYVAEFATGYTMKARTARELAERLDVTPGVIFDYIRKRRIVSRGKLAGYKFYKERPKNETTADET